MAIDFKFNTPFLNDYLEMVEETESPRIFHIWAAVGAIAAALGRRCYFPFGDGEIFPNQYILMVGTPGTRKSTVLRIMKKTLRKSTGVKFAPDDTAGQRQGLIKAMMSNSESETLYLNGAKVDERDNSLAGLSLMEIASISTEAESEEQQAIDEADKQHLMATSDEFSRFVGQNNLQMLDFLTSTWDGTSYDYQTNSRSITIKAPLLNLSGCTTPVSLASSMPPGAGGQGFLSRMILVYGASKYKMIPRPQPLPEDATIRVREQLDNIYNEMNGAFDETDDARSFSENLYGYPLEIVDSRFEYYNERRYTHLIKLAMCLAAGSNRTVIELADYNEAHRILRATERGMPNALGEFGLNPLAALKQSMLDFIRTKGTIGMEDLRGHFHRDARSNDFTEVLNDLNRAKHIVMQPLRSGTLISARHVIADVEDQMLKMLAPPNPNLLTE